MMLRAGQSLAFVLVLANTFADTTAGFLWKDAAGNPLPFQDPETIERYLLEARVVGFQEVESGSTRPLKVHLEKDGIQFKACFRHVSISGRAVFESGRVESNFRDDAVFEIAAYRLSRMLGTLRIPPTVFRTINGRCGSLQLWVPDCLTEKDRIQADREPDNRTRWAQQVQTMRLFDNLIANEDRNQGNMLFDARWELWLIDHTRAFRTGEKLATPQLINGCPRTIWRKLAELSLEQLQEELGDLLEDQQLESILHRRDRILEALNGLIEQRGEERVLFDLAKR